MSNWGKVHCISRTYYIISRPSKNWGNHKNAINELCKWTPEIIRHDHTLRKLHIKLCRSNLYPSYLAKKKVEFKLKTPKLDAIRKLKLLATSILSENPNLQTHLKIDANSDGLGVLLEQNHRTLSYPKWYPVRYASWSLQDYEKHYTQIEKETLSIAFGIERFHEYFYGCKFKVINDNQQLQPIISECTVIFPPHIHKFFLGLQKHEFDLKYSPGKTILVSDALNRAYIKNSNPEFDENSLIYHVQFGNENCFIHHVQFGNEKCFIITCILEQCIEKVWKDPTLQNFLKYTIERLAWKNFYSTWITSVFYPSYILPWRATSQRPANNCPHCYKIRNEVHITSRTFRHRKLHKRELVKHYFGHL